MRDKLHRKPVLIMLIGYPGAGKTYFCRNFSSDCKYAHIQEDKIRSSIFDNPDYSEEEDEVVARTIEIMVEEFLKRGISLLFDSDASSKKSRRELAATAKELGGESFTVWVQTDIDTAFDRASNRDRRRPDEKYAKNLTRSEFNELKSAIQKPEREKYSVISGKHDYKIQRVTVLKKLESHKLIRPPLNHESDSQKADLSRIKLGGRVDFSRRSTKI